MCPDCYDYTGHVLFNALAPELWRRFTIYLPRQLARLAGITQRQLRSEVRVRYVKVAEYQHRGIIHYHTVIRLDAPGDSHQPPPPREKLSQVQHDARSGIPVPDKVWKLGPYLDYWLENFVKRNRPPATYNLYEMIVRLYLKPVLGGRKLTSLTVPMVQEFLNRRLQKGDAIRRVQVMRTVLSAALTRAVREELIVRNVARLVELPQWQRGQIRPWAADEARAFLAAAKPDPLYTVFVLLILYGLRRGEVLGLRWDDIDFDGGTIHIHQQLQRVHGELFLAPVKTQAGKRGLPLLDAAEQALKLQTERQALYRIDMGSAWPET